MAVLRHLTTSILLLLLGTYAFAVPFTCNAGRCNQYVQERICDKDDPENWGLNFKNNETDVFIGIAVGLTTNFATFFEPSQIGALCAIEALNNDPSVLPNVTIHPVFADDRPSQGIEGGLCLGRAGINMAIGSTSSVVSVGLANMGKVFNTHYVGIMPTSSQLSNKDPDYGFPTFSRVSSSDAIAGNIITAICKQFNWQRLGVISIANDPYSDAIFESVVTHAPAKNITIIKSATISKGASDSEVALALNIVRESGARLILLLLSPNSDVRGNLFDVARTLDMERGYTYLVSSTLVTAVETFNGTIGFDTKLDTTDSNPAWRHLSECWTNHRDDTSGPFADRGSLIKLYYSSPPTQFAGQAYDAMMVAARALGRVPVSQHSDMSAIRDGVTGLNFQGSTGKIAMSSTGDRTGVNFVIYNIRPEGPVAIGNVDSSTLESSLHSTPFFGFDEEGNEITLPKRDYFLECDKFDESQFTVSVSDCNVTRTLSYTPVPGDPEKYCDTIPDEEIPCDRPSISNSGPALAIVGMGLTFLISILLLTLACYKHPVIRKGQRMWLLVLIAGGILAQLSPLFSLTKVTGMSCAQPVVLLIIGGTLQYGTLLLKSWRVMRIMVLNKSMAKMKITNKDMSIRLMTLLGIATILLVALLTLDPPLPVTVLNKEQHPVTICQTKDGLYGTLLLVYAAGVIVVTCMISFTIRKVSSDFSEAFYIFLSTYNSSLCCIAALGFVYLVQTTALVTHIVISIATTITVCCNVGLIMIPKFMNIMRNVKVSISKSGVTGGQSNTGNTASGLRVSAVSTNNNNLALTQDNQDAMTSLKVENKRLQDENEQLKSELLKYQEQK